MEKKEKITCCKVVLENGENCGGGGFKNPSGTETFAKGYCRVHYERLRTYGDINYQEIIRDGRALHYLSRVYSAMVSRCTNPKNKGYKNYGERLEVPIQPEWLDRKTGCWLYYKYIEENLGHRPSDKHSIDRINNDLGYVIGNLRWADDYTQSSNRRGNTKNVGVRGNKNGWLAELTTKDKVYFKYFPYGQYDEAVSYRKWLEETYLPKL